MKFRLQTAAAAILAICLAASVGSASEIAKPVKKHTATKKAKTPPPPTVAEQIQTLRQELEGQINGLKADLAEKDAQLKRAELAAAAAQAAAEKAQAATSAQQQEVSDTEAAVARINEAAKSLAAPGPAKPSLPPAAQTPPSPIEAAAPAVPANAINAALTPIRFFPVDGVQKNDLHPAIKAEGVGFIPYGFIRVTAIEDSSSPNGDDFPLPGFLTDTPPNGSPEFHIKARSSRLGPELRVVRSQSEVGHNGQDRNGLRG